LACGPGLNAESPAEAKRPALAEVERLIRQLGSDEFARREAASQALLGIGEPALPALYEAAHSRDAEAGSQVSSCARPEYSSSR
jgi:hypothetical protein